MKAKTTEKADELLETFDGQPTGWIQWKGTDVCMDVRCKCGKLSHLDAEFAYHVECPHCGAVYLCNPNIQLIEVEERPDHCVQRSI